MRWPALLRGAIGLTLVVITAVTWTIYRAIDQANESPRWIAHIQTEIGELETVLNALVTAENAVVDIGAPGNSQRIADVITSAERSATAAIDRVAEMTSDDPRIQQQIEPLRQAFARAMNSLRLRAVAADRSEVMSREATDLERSNLNGARTILLTMRGQEDQLLRQRAMEDQAAIRGLEWTAAAIGVVSVVLVSLVLWLFARDMGRRQRSAEQLLDAKLHLEARVDEQSIHLRETAARLQSIIDSAVDAIIVIDKKGRIESFNRAAERLFGYATSEAIGQNVSILMPSPHREEHNGHLARYLETGAARVIGIGRQVEGRRRDGSTFPLHLAIGEMEIGGERKFTGILHDLTLRVRFEEQLREQASLVRLGEMAAVIAHEVKNPLAGIRGAIQVIGSRLPSDSRDVGIAREIVSRIDGLNALIRDLLLFARPPQPRPATVDLGSLVNSTVEILSNDPALKDLQVTMEGAVPLIEGDAELLKIVFVNLLVNSAHAMGGRGTIRVSLGVVGTACQIDFIDSGPGIPSDIREKIFTPFFTTKSRGSGLGLSTAKRLIEAHGGRISIVCPAGGGTTVSIQLPVPQAVAEV